MKNSVVTVTLNPSIDKTIVIEKLLPYGLNRVVRSRTDPGGKGINVARVLKNFAVDVTVTGLIAGQQGKLLLEALQNAGIPADFLEIEGETRTNLKIFDESVNKTTEVNETGFRVSPEDLVRFRKKFQNLIQKAEIVVLSGSLPPGIPQNFYSDCVAAAKTAGAKVLLDADGGALEEGIRAIPYAVKPNLQELEALSGCKFSGKKDIAEAARRLTGTGIEIVIVSMGADGAVVANREEAYAVDSWNIPVKSATGAGDSMVAALAGSILNNSSLYEIAKITTAAGTVTASKEGTLICSQEEVARSLDYVTVRKI
ncbi:Tagatose-6-phosphate kinase [Caprobacter fermentans]|uniref:Tagatose-6-phosphate kinase n=1 Tax=Caproicibacter fermentans TaxID=2576756 RepID=A0A6N8HW99_9FIRM|nr:1-phosphofructokinase [Caproicibacter fermentans]MVB09830.1 Tagatose-6-phosphate kinase [Caproicibacter fermentans]